MEFEDSKGRKYTVASGTIMYRGMKSYVIADYEPYLDSIDAVLDGKLMEYILSHSFSNYMLHTSLVLEHCIKDEYGIFATNGKKDSITIIQGNDELQIDNYLVDIIVKYRFRLNDKTVEFEYYEDDICEKIGKYLIVIPTKSARNFN